MTAVTGRERVARALELEPADRPPFHLSFGAGSAGTVPLWARDWPIRAGVDVIESPDAMGDAGGWTLNSGRLSSSVQPPASSAAFSERACRSVLEQPWPDPADPALYRPLERLARAHPDRAFFFHVPGLFDRLESILGFETFLAAVSHAPALAGQVMERLVTTGATIASEAVRRGAAALLFREPIAGAGGLRVGLELLDQWVFPFDRLLLEGLVRADVPVVAWCPGGGDAVWQRFAQLGARLVGPLPGQPAALASFRERWSGRLGIYGALDGASIIPHGTPDEIRRHVQEMFDATGPEGGLIFSAADLPPETPMGNLDALLDAIRECRYPARG